MDEETKNLAGKELSQSRVVEPGDLMEEARLVHSAVGDQEMEVRMDIDPVPKCLNGGDDSGPKLASAHDFEIAGQ